MTELKIDYDKACEFIPRGMNTEDQKYQSLMESSILGSINTASKAEFQERFKDSPDNIETQVKMYGFLLDDVCNRIDRGIQRLETNEKKAKKMAVDLKNGMRIVYTMIAFSPVVSLEEDDMPLAMAYFQEKLGEIKPNSEIIEKTLNSYLSTLKIKEASDEKKVTVQLLASLEAALL